jgi:hypothetical protein
MIPAEKVDFFQAFYEKPAPLDFVLPGMLAGTVGALVSPGGLGKSMFALQVAAQISGGPDLMGLGSLRNGRVLYLPAEDPVDSLKHRVFAFGNCLNEEQKQVVRENLLIRSLIGTPINLLEKKSFELIRDLAQGRRLVII